MAHDVFISYASGDKVVADAVCSQLESLHRIRCWIAPRDITPGASWAGSIIDALDSAKIMVLIFSNSANASTQIEREVERAVHKGINIIPLRIENAQPTKTLEYFISAPHWLDALSVPMEQHIDKLAASVKSLLARSDSVAAAVAAVHAVPPLVTSAVMSTAAPPAAPAAASGPETARPPQTRLVAVAAGVVIVALVLAGGYRLLSGRRAPAQPLPSAASETTSASAATSAAASTPPPAVPAPAPAAPAAAEAGATAPPAAPSTVTAKTKPNFYIDFVNPISEGKISVSIDGRERWAASLAPFAGPTNQASSGAAARSDAFKTFTQALTLPPGTHTIDVLLLHPDGKTREQQATTVTLTAAEPHTLRIRLSRFKRDLQLTTVAGAPGADAPVPAAKPADKTAPLDKDAKT